MAIATGEKLSRARWMLDIAESLIGLVHILGFLYVNPKISTNFAKFGNFAKIGPAGRKI